MSARDVILLALTKHHRREPDAHGTALETLAQYDTAHRAELLHERTHVRDHLYREAYTLGRTHAGADSFLFDNYEPGFTTSDGSHVPATELLCRNCTALIQGVGPHTLLDLMAMAAQHTCKDTRS